MGLIQKLGERKALKKDLGINRITIRTSKLRDLAKAKVELVKAEKMREEAEKMGWANTVIVAGEPVMDPAYGKTENRRDMSGVRYTRKQIVNATGDLKRRTELYQRTSEIEKDRAKKKR